MSATQAAQTTSARPQLVAARDPREIAAIGRQTGKQAGGGNVKAFFEANKETIAAVLPEHMTPDRMLKIALGALRTTPKLLDCNIHSFFGAVVVCAQLGLEPNTPQGHIYLIPFKNGRSGDTDVQIVIGYKGLIDLARRSGQIVSLSARAIYAKDTFSIDYGTEDRIVHTPYLGGERGPMVGVYAVAKLQGGGTQFEFMSIAEINAVRDGSQGYQTAKRFGKTNTPWHTHYEEMARKTAIRRLSKYLPMSIEMARAVALDEREKAMGRRDGSAVLDGDFSVLEMGDGDGGDGEQVEDNGKPAAVTHQPEQQADFDHETGEVREPEPVRTSEPAPKRQAAPKPAQQPQPDMLAPGALADDDDDFPS